MNTPFLELHMPISPIPFFFNRVRYIAKSVRSCGGRYADARIVVSVGDPNPPYDLDAAMPWAREEGIEWRWVATEPFLKWKDSKFPYVYTMMDRFRDGFTADYVVIGDADIMFMRPIDDLIALLDGDLDVGGVMTHVPPFPAEHYHLVWKRMFEAFGLPLPLLEYEYSGWNDMFFQPELRFGPAYFNSGMVIGTRAAMNRMAPMAIPALDAVASVLDIFFYDQIAFTLMMYKAQVNKKLIPVRFNFPNQTSFEKRFPADFDNLGILHFLRTDQVHRDKVFESRENIEAFIKRTDLTGSNEKLRARVSALHGMIHS